MELFRAKHALFAHHILGGVKINAVEGHVIPIPVVLAFLNDDASVERPLIEGECAITHNVANARPRCEPVGHLPMLQKRFRVYRKATVVIHQLKKVGRGCVQGDLERQIVECLYTHLLKVRDFSLGVRLRINDGVEHVSVKRAGVIVEAFPMI